jgi:RNA polymerase sigma-70 factor (ECF subfamily)
MAAPVVTREERLCFERSVLPHTRALRGKALQLSRSSAEADDLVQETVLKAWRFWSGYRERETCRAWLQRILLNTFVSQRRRATRERAVLALAADEYAVAQSARSWAPRLERDSVDDRLLRDLADLSSEQRQVLWLVDVEEQSYRDAAAQLGWPLGTVMSRLHRARRALQARLSAPHVGAGLAMAGHA